MADIIQGYKGHQIKDPNKIQALGKVIENNVSMGHATEMIKKEIMNFYQKRAKFGTDDKPITEIQRRRFYWLISEPGVGKTSSIQNLENEATNWDGSKWPGCAVQSIDCTQLVPGQIPGILAPSLQTNEQGERVRAIRLKVEGVLPEPPDKDHINDPNYPYNKPGILFLDEISSLNWEVRSELLTLCCATRFQESDGRGGKKWPLLPPLWIVVMAGNTEATIQSQIQQWGKNVRMRFHVYHVHANYDDWKKWATSHKHVDSDFVGIHPLVLSFLDEHPEYLQIALGQDQLMNFEGVSASPRGWEDVSELLYDRDLELESGFYSMDPKYAAEQLKMEISEAVGPVFQEFLTYIDFQKEMVPIKVMLSEDLSKNATKYKKYLGSDKSAKLISIYTAINRINSDPVLNKNIKAKMKTCVYALTNAEWLISSTQGTSRDMMTSLIDNLRSGFDNPSDFKISELPASLQKAAIASSMYTEK